MAGLNEFGRNIQNIHRRISISLSTSTTTTELETIDENPITEKTGREKPLNLDSPKSIS